MQMSNGLYLPKIEEEKCNKCKLCVKSCPGHLVNFDELNSRIFGKQPEDRRLGNYLKCYVGHSNDDEIRHDSSSGGIAPQVLIFALEKGLINGALVVRMAKNNPLETESFIARTRKEIISASKSKYCPAAANETIRQILKEKGRFAVVGLPCHIHGIQKAGKNLKELREKVVLHVGLMCSHTVNFFGTELLLKKLGMMQKQIEHIEYRGRGWPGSMLIRSKTHSKALIPCARKWNAYWPVFSSFFFTPKRCLMCPDETNELADISLGDAWLPELRNQTNGESIAVTRTKQGEEILNLAHLAGLISLQPIESERVKQSQAIPLKLKKDDLETRLAIMESAGMKTPIFYPKPNSSRLISSYLRNFFALFNAENSANRLWEPLLVGTPFPIFRLYYGIYKFLSAF